uniref:Uncharacterized protein n=1 Tax=Tanacetum cinerariifolium TaxID=118510 RepID=A0A699HJY1_TANCI|nr:hypothetical protein [Tanacetum cinerariifolium]
MSDSSGGGMSDLDDMDDIEMIMQQLQLEQELEQAAGSSNRRKYIYHECLEAEERFETDYFGAHPKYPDYYFRRRYRMNRKLFLEIVASIDNYIQTHHPLPLHFDFFRVRPDATGLPGFSVIMKCSCVIRQLAYGVTPDALDGVVVPELGIRSSNNDRNKLPVTYRHISSQKICHISKECDQRRRKASLHESSDDDDKENCMENVIHHQHWLGVEDIDITDVEDAPEYLPQKSSTPA